MMRFTLILCGLTLLAACQKMETLSAYGTLERDRLTLLATESEIIVEQRVAEGAHVSRGEVLLRLDSTRQQARIAQAEAEAERARAALLQLQHGSREEHIASARARVNSADSRLREAERQLVRLEQLRDQALVSAAARDQAQLERDLAAAQLADFNQQWLEVQRGSRAETVQQAEAALASAEAALALEQLRLEDLSVRATRDGVLEDFPWQLGERVPAGAVVAIVVADTEAYARLYLPQTSLSQFQLGDRVQIFADGREAALSGHLRFISRQASFTPYFALHQEERVRLMYVAEVVLEGAQNLPNGLPLRMPLP